jgi:PilZ domain
VAERRAHPRIKGPFEGWWDGTSRQSGRLVDLSMGGCFVESVQLPNNGQVIVVSIAVQNGQINVSGEVLYSELNQGFAVRFVDMPDGVADLLRNELDRKLSG